MRSGRCSDDALKEGFAPVAGDGEASGTEPSLPASPPPSRKSETRNLFPTYRLVELSPGDGSGIDAESPARGIQTAT
jgi:hypothetical protein